MLPHDEIDIYVGTDEAYVTNLMAVALVSIGSAIAYASKAAVDYLSVGLLVENAFSPPGQRPLIAMNALQAQLTFAKTAIAKNLNVRKQLLEGILT